MNLCEKHPDLDHRTEWGCPKCADELGDALLQNQGMGPEEMHKLNDEMHKMAKSNWYRGFVLGILTESALITVVFVILTIVTG